MTIFDLVLQSDMTAVKQCDASPLGVMRMLHDAWERRTNLAWKTSHAERDGEPAHPTRLDLKVSISERRERPGSWSARIECSVAASDPEGAILRLMRAIDLPHESPMHPRKPVETGIMAMPTITRLRGTKTIGPMDPSWPVGKSISDFSEALGSYGQGGIGLAGWQLNRGSWIVLPISNSSGWLTLRTITCGDYVRSATNPSVDIAVDQRIVGVHPDQLDRFHPWDHHFAGPGPRIDDLPAFRDTHNRIVRFDARPDGFRLEAANGIDRWIFEMGDHLPRPVWGGSGRERLLDEGVDVGASFVMTHDCYLDV